MDAFFQRRFMQFQSICSSWDMKNGGTPLHWSTMKEVVIALVELALMLATLVATLLCMLWYKEIGLSVLLLF
jgi:hypothetical protein